MRTSELAGSCPVFGRSAAECEASPVSLARAVLMRVDVGKLGSQKENQGGVVHPDQDRHR